MPVPRGPVVARVIDSIDYTASRWHDEVIAMMIARHRDVTVAAFRRDDRFTAEITDVALSGQWIEFDIVRRLNGETFRYRVHRGKIPGHRAAALLPGRYHQAGPYRVETR